MANETLETIQRSKSEGRCVAFCTMSIKPAEALSRGQERPAFLRRCHHEDRNYH